MAAPGRADRALLCRSDISSQGLKAKNDLFRTLQASAVDRLDQGDIRDAAGKVWGVTQRATDALVLGIRELLLAKAITEVDPLVGQYFTRISYYHSNCFHDGCEDWPPPPDPGHAQRHRGRRALHHPSDAGPYLLGGSPATGERMLRR